MGLNTILIIAGVFVAVLIIAIPLWNIKRTDQLKKTVERMVYVTTMKKSGNRVNGLYPADEHTVRVKRQGEKRQASIVLNPENTFNMLYPPFEGTKSLLGKIFSPTVTVRSIVVAETHPAGWKPFSEEPEITDEELEAIKKQSFTRAAMEAGYNFTSGDGFGKFPIKRMQLLGGSMLIIVMLIAIAAMSYIIMTRLEEVAVGWGL